MAWESMERDGYEADKSRLFVMNLETGKKKDYTQNFDQSVGHLAWSNDNNTLWFLQHHTQ